MTVKPESVEKGVENMLDYVIKSPKVLLLVAMGGVIVYIIRKHRETVAKLNALLDAQGIDIDTTTPVPRRHKAVEESVGDIVPSDRKH